VLSESDFFDGRDIRIHIPAGAVPKDGPPAGVTIVMALISLLTGRPARRDVALTGELTLSGRILPLGGIREKIFAAQRSGVRTVVFPQSNQIDIDGLEGELREGVEVDPAREVGSLLDVVLV
jgi:ATP-dependent Lon protease